MNREYHRWYSPSLGRDMELLIFGHGGLPVIVYPTSRGRFYEWEDRGMVGALGHRIDPGNLRLCCVDSIDGESWYNYGAHPRQRIERHLAYERYLLDEVIPLIHRQAPGYEDRRVGTTGTSLGAFHAALFAFRFPASVSVMLAMSGKFDNTMFVYGYHDELTYLTNPLAFLANLDDPRHLDPMRNMGIAIVTGRTDPNITESIKLSEILDGKGIPNTLDLWDGWSHDWPYWQEMVRKYL
jgi:esterase/lipase superfamily enzyme